jgi:hypothetical protein
MASIQHLLNNDLGDLVVDPDFTHDFGDATPPFLTNPWDWDASDWRYHIHLS